jgi:hypothetical protein
MSKFIPSGYLSLHEALDRLGRDIFGAEWIGEERKARRGLISQDEWSRIKDLPPARGGGAPGSPRWSGSTGALAENSGSHDPSDPIYQAEYQASERYEAACRQLRTLLESGQLEAAILDPFTGKLHRASTSLWRRANADRMIESGRAPIPGSPNTGSLVVKRFAEANVHPKPMPAAKIREAIEALKEKIATESLTRAQQADFLRKTFSSYHLTERQFREISQAVPVSPGRPKKSDKRV